MIRTLFAAALLSTLPSLAHALIMVHQGEEPVENRGWAEGAEKVANLPGRIGYWEAPPFGGGQYVFEFAPADTATFQTAIDTLATIPSKNLKLEIVNATHTSTFLETGKDSETKATVGYSLTLWVKASWDQLYNNDRSSLFSDQPGYGQPVPGPLLTLYLRPGDDIDPRALDIPDNIDVSDSRLASADLPDHLKKPGNAVVTGHVTDLHTGLPVPGASVTLAPARPAPGQAPVATTGADGSFTLVWTGGHHVYIHATRDGYAPRRSSTHLSLLADTHHGNHHLTLARSGQLSGTVTTGDGSPLPGAEITATSTLAHDASGYPQPETPPVTSAADGTFTLTNLPKDGSTQIRVRAPGRYATDSLASHPVSTDKTVIIRTVGTGTITGVVAEHPSGRFKDRAWNVSIQEEGRTGVGSWGGSTNCAADRTFTFDHVPAGTYTLVTNTPKSKGVEPPTPATVTVTAGATTTVTLVP